ncbi:MAG: alcohol dehydrogenase catalytic domain-containing protein [Fimbriimonadales bacterium]|nr:alcohol dehydrogenase catalytic domain-containing protein [Fimbriimonadales bacterium]
MPVPTHYLRWNLYGAGWENLGREGKPERLPTPQPAPNEILVRIDAVGICFSDLKILRLGEAHPKIARDLRQHPVVMGHEISCTIAQAGDALKDRFQVGERYIVQADVYVGGRVRAVGYALDGGYSQYTVFGEPVLNGDVGCYLLRCPEHLSYAEAALVEPWACVVASYRIQPRPTPQPNGRWLVVIPHAPMVRYRCSALQGLALNPSPSPTASERGADGVAVIIVDSRGSPLADEFLHTAQQLGMTTERVEVPEESLYDPALLQRLRESHAPDGFTDILLFGNPTPALLESALDALCYGGALSFTCHHKLDAVPVDVGRLHYDRLLVMGTTGWDITDAYRHTRDSALRKGDRLLLFGAGGAMGQMQLFYALTRPEPPAQVVVVDRHPERLEPLRELGTPLAQQAGVELQFYCNADAEPEAQQAYLRTLCPHGFDQIMLLASSPDAVSLTYPLLTDGGVLNLFAGIPKGQKVPLDITRLASRHMRLLGSSGSTMDDIAECLRLAAEGALPARKVIGAIAGLNALPDALRAVQEHCYPGKIVIFPQLPDLPLLGLHELATRLPEVHAHLGDGRYWTQAAEGAMYAYYRPSAAIGED